jgi:hypothetical protein
MEKRTSRKEINIIAFITALPCFALSFFGTWLMAQAEVDQLIGTIMALMFMFSGAWAAGIGQERLYQLRKNGYKKERN